MKKPSPDDMIYAGLVLRLGLATEAEIQNMTSLDSYRDKSFIDIVLARGFVTPEQHLAIQWTLRSMELMEAFGGPGADPQRHGAAGDPTLLVPGAGETAGPFGEEDETPTLVTSEPPRPQAASARPRPAPARGEAELEQPTMVSNVPPPAASSASAPLSGPSPGGSSAAWDAEPTRDWSTLTGQLSQADITRVEKSKQAYRRDRLIGKQLGSHVLLDRLGRGGMGDVYLAKQLTLNRYVALKVLPRSMARRPDFVERFVGEAQTLARITFNNIVQVYDVGAEHETVYFTMELVKGRTIHDMIRESKTLPVGMAVNVVKQSCRALARVAREGIIHRDIKPGNIMLTDDGEVKVCDFGIATETLDEMRMKEIVGTPYYMAPEYVAGKGCSSATDQYALGVTLHHMLGGLPEKTEGPHEFKFDLPFLSNVNSAIPEPLARIVARMTRPDPEERYGSFEEIFRDLEDFELRAGYIKAPSEFLAERLVNLREGGLENFKQRCGVMAAAAAAFTGVAILTSKILAGAGFHRTLGVLGGIGTLAIVVAYLMILYVGLARKRILPAKGNLRSWVELHYSIALSGYFAVMVHGGNFLGWKTLKSLLGPIPGLNAGSWNDVPSVAFFASASLFAVIVSGLIGRFIFRELHAQLALQRFGQGSEPTPEDRQTLTRIVIGTKIMGYWRILHYPMTVFMILLTAMHVVSLMYYGSGFFG